MGSIGTYQARQFNLSGLKGISDQTLEMHFKLYEGYVKETNNLTERITEFIKDGNVDQEEMPAYSELTRRLGFEYNGLLSGTPVQSQRPQRDLRSNVGNALQTL